MDPDIDWSSIIFDHVKDALASAACGGAEPRLESLSQLNDRIIATYYRRDEGTVATVIVLRSANRIEVIVHSGR